MKKKQKAVKKDKVKEIPIDKQTMEKALAIIKERNITKVAHRPSGKVIWLHMEECEGELRDSIATFLTSHPNMTIHQLGELALCKLLDVELREYVKSVAK